MKISVKRQVPPGSVRGTFFGIEETEHPEFGDGLCWAWVITSGAYKGEKVFRTTKPPASNKNATGKFLSAMTGMPLEQATDEDMDAYKGTLCLLIIAATDSGSTRVESFVVEPPPDDPEAGPAVAAGR